MAVVHLNQQQLAARWCVSEATLERWRCEGLGPRFLKLCGRVLDRQVDIDVYEESCLATSSLTQGGLRSKVSYMIALVRIANSTRRCRDGVWVD